MLTKVHPPLEGIAAERFLSLAKQLASCQKRRIAIEFDTLCDSEVSWARSNPHLNGCRKIYEAAARVLIDLARLSWTVEQEGYSIELRSPLFRPQKTVTPMDIMNHKQSVRRELAALCEAQLREPSTRRFIKSLENPSAQSDRKSILNLIADGQELHDRLQSALNTSAEERSLILSEIIQPYLQLVPADNEPTLRDQFTGIPLRDIWRYFRYTWTIPQLPIPGRQLLYLVRDRAHPCHAIMGIAALNNSAMQMKERDNFIGWTLNAFVDTVGEVLNSDDHVYRLRCLFEQLEKNVSDALKNIEKGGLVSDFEALNPTPEILDKLRHNSQRFATLREEALKRSHVAENQSSYVYNIHYDSDEIPSVSGDVLALEGKTMTDTAFTEARKMLVGKKRAFELYRLLHSRYFLKLNREAFLSGNSDRVRKILTNDSFRTAVSTALHANKSARIGVNMLELTTCGAIRPYNLLLTGKLTALLMLSPQVLNDYRLRYGQAPSIIASQLNNAPVYRDPKVVYIGTTSLYALGSSQYNRIKLPSGTISPDQAEMRYKRIGYTSGFGTVQFSPETVRAVERVFEQTHGYQNVNSVFGEGPSPRLRKLTTGLTQTGFNPDVLMRHNQHRVIYGVLLCKVAQRFLLGESVELPYYINNPGKYLDATAAIASFWRERWLNHRINHTPTMNNLLFSYHWSLSENMPIQMPKTISEEVPSTAMTTSGRQNEFALNRDLEFWRSLASAGPNVCADELGQDVLGKLHVALPLEDFLSARVNDGYSIVLTGNAGDGKTHILRCLAPKLTEYGAIIQYDATAAMRNGDVTPILDEWRAALSSGRPYCLAANEYPLYQLRTKGRNNLPILDEVDRQCRQRLAYGLPSSSEEAKVKVLVVDLSIRNPLASPFVGRMLDRIFSDAALRRYADCKEDPNFSFNYFRLSHPVVRDRVLNLFHRIILRGGRASVREIWIILAKALFGYSGNSDRAALSWEDSYSERFFQGDSRFALSGLLSGLCDPTHCSHPQWDRFLDHPGGTKPSDWLIDNQEPLLTLDGDVTKRFDAMKRRFYFEHRQGADASFALEDDTTRKFIEILTDAATPDETLKRQIIETINLSYCPSQFSGIRESLYLWSHLRLHERSTRSYLANQKLSSDHFQIMVPRIPSRLGGSIDYIADHFILSVSVNNKCCKLAIDYQLYKTLDKIRNGLPRHLVSERDTNRLDQFLDELQTVGIPQEREFYAFNTEHQLFDRINLSAGGRSYKEVHEL